MTDVYDPKDLTRDQVPGLTDQQLNDVAAQLVMGWKLRSASGSYLSFWKADKVHYERGGWHPATDLNHAAMLTERMARRGWGFAIRNAFGEWVVTAYHPDDYGSSYNRHPSRARAETEANVLAALWERQAAK